MSFQDMLNQEIAELESNRGGGDFEEVTHPSSTLKHDMLYLTKDTPEYLVRILPPTKPEDFFAVGVRRMFFDVTNAAGKRINSPMIMPLQGDPENSLLDRKVQEWVQNKSMPGQYPDTRPQTRYYINVVRVQPLGGGQYQHEMEDDGVTPMIRVMEVPVTAYRGIINELSDTNIASPEGAGQYGPIDGANAYPFKINRTGERLSTEYHVRMYENPLGPLPGGWEEHTPDLNYIATPSEEYNEEFVHYMIAVHEGREQEFNAERGQGGGDNTQSTPAPTQNQGFNQPQNQGFNQPQNQGFNQPVTDADMGHLPPKNEPTPAPQQGGFTQPQQGGFEQPQQGGFSQPAQGTTPAPQQPAPQQPAPQATQPQGFSQQEPGGIPNVDDLIAKVQQDANK